MQAAYIKQNEKDAMKKRAEIATIGTIGICVICSDLKKLNTINIALEM